jgi:hypothetical protein
MTWRVASVLLLLVTGCPGDENDPSPPPSAAPTDAGACKTPASPALDLQFPGEVGCLVPYGPKGTFDVRVIGTLAGLNAPATATLEFIDGTNPQLPAAATVTLQLETIGGSTLSGTVRLAYPNGPPFSLRAHALGAVIDETVPLERPEIAAQFAEGRPVAGRVAGSVCVETTATGGVLELTVINATFESGMTTERRTLGTTDCDLFEGRPFRSGAAFPVVLSGGPLLAEAALVDTPFRMSRTPPLWQVEPGNFVFELTSTPVDLPAPGLPVVLHAKATAGTDAGTHLAKGLPVSFESVPELDILPVSTVFDAAGNAEATFIAPEGPAVHIDLVAGGKRTGHTISRP